MYSHVYISQSGGSWKPRPFYCAHRARFPSPPGRISCGNLKFLLLNLHIWVLYTVELIFMIMWIDIIMLLIRVMFSNTQYWADCPHSSLWWSLRWSLWQWPLCSYCRLTLIRWRLSSSWSCWNTFFQPPPFQLEVVWFQPWIQIGVRFCAFSSPRYGPRVRFSAFFQFRIQIQIQ